MKKDENITLDKLKAADAWLKKENGGKDVSVNIGKKVKSIIKQNNVVKTTTKKT
jgi:hypothetical protein